MKQVSPPCDKLPWSGFSKFINADADRFSILEELLLKCSLNFKVLNISGNKHFIVIPDGEKKRSHSPKYKPTILVAHYDRALNSPGANDNSAAIFLLIETAIKLKADSENNWIIIFTDKEELNTDDSLKNQGSYSLAQGLIKMGMEKSRIFIFDACGTGDSLIVSTTAELLLKKEKTSLSLVSSIQKLRQNVLDIARDLNIDNLFLSPTPFSDDAGFLRAGIAAQTITMLPLREYNALITFMRNNPLLSDALISRQKNQSIDNDFIPLTWKNMNGPNDTPDNLTPKNFGTVVRFAFALCKSGGG